MATTLAWTNFLLLKVQASSSFQVNHIKSTLTRQGKARRGTEQDEDTLEATFKGTFEATFEANFVHSGVVLCQCIVEMPFFADVGASEFPTARMDDLCLASGPDRWTIASFELKM